VTEAADKGKAAEEATAFALEMLGFRVIERNRKVGRLELDIVAERNGTTVAVEARAREAGSMVNGMESITDAKRDRVETAARAVARGGDMRVLYASIVLRAGKVSEIEILDEGF